MNSSKEEKKMTAKRLFRIFEIASWVTEEMQSLIEWMKFYNQNHPDNQLSFIGIDMQDGNHMVQEANKLLSSYNAENLIELPEQLRDKVHDEW